MDLVQAVLEVDPVLLDADYSVILKPLSYLQLSPSECQSPDIEHQL